MTEHNGGEQPQKTVAELLAQHGAQVDGVRRRRRRADDDEQPDTAEPGGSRRKPSMGDTAPQAIIDRVTADSGNGATGNGGRRAQPESGPRRAESTSGSHASGHFARPVAPAPQDSGQSPRPPQDSVQLPRPQESAQLPRPQDSAQLPRPVVPPVPQESGQLPLPPRGRGGPRQQPPAAPGRIPAARSRPAGPPPVTPPVPAAGAMSAQLDGLDGQPEPAVSEPSQPPPPGPGQMGSGAFQNPPRRPGPAFRPAPPNAEEYTEQFPAIVRDEAEAPESVDEPPAPDEPPAGLANWRKRRRKVATDDTEIGVMPAYSDEPVEPEPDAGMLDPGPPTRGFAPPPPFAPAWANPPRGDEHPDFDDDLHDGHNGHHGYPELNGAQLDDEYDYDDDLDEYEAELDDLDDLHEPDDEFDEPEEQVSPAKQWLTLAGQLALGVVGGAAVWLGFNWLWVNLPAAALIAALLVVVGLVWIVRKIRRAEDLQTTVLAVLVGLVVTVSPAALLLVSR